MPKDIIHESVKSYDEPRPKCEGAVDTWTKREHIVTAGLSALAEVIHRSPCGYTAEELKVDAAQVVGHRDDTEKEGGS